MHGPAGRRVGAHRCSGGGRAINRVRPGGGGQVGGAGGRRRRYVRIRSFRRRGAKSYDSNASHGKRPPPDAPDSGAQSPSCKTENDLRYVIRTWACVFACIIRLFDFKRLVRMDMISDTCSFVTNWSQRNIMVSLAGLFGVAFVAMSSRYPGVGGGITPSPPTSLARTQTSILSETRFSMV